MEVLPSVEVACNDAETPMDDVVQYDERDELLDALFRIGYEPIPSEESWMKALEVDSREDGTIPAVFVSVCTFLVNQICDECELPNAKMTERNGDAESASFGLELRSFLTDLGSHLSQNGIDLVEQPVQKRKLVDYLIAELEACRLCKKKDPKFSLLTPTTLKPTSSLHALSKFNEDGESDCARAIKQATKALGFPRPPDTITCAQLFDKVESRVRELLQRFDDYARSALMGRPLLTFRLSDRQTTALHRLIEMMNAEYLARRAVLLKRFDLTVDAFGWSEVVVKAKKETKVDPMSEILANARPKLTLSAPIGVAELLAARDDVLRVAKTCSDSTRVRTDLYRVLIGAVPDRGGRAWEADPPERESFAKQQRFRGHGSGGGRGGQRGGSGYSGSRQGSYRGGSSNRGHHPHSYPQNFNPAQDQASFSNPYANPHFNSQQANVYQGQAYDGPGAMQSRPYHPQRGGRGRVQRGRPY